MFDFLPALVALPLICASDVVGIVSDSNGRPVSGARVVNLSKRDVATATLPDGLFRIEGNAATPFLVEHGSYGPRFFLGAAPGERQQIVLDDLSKQHWSIPRCKGPTKSSPDPLKTLVLPRHRGLKKRLSSDVDFELLTLSARGGSPEIRLWQRVISRGMPSATWFNGIAAVTLTRSLDLDGSKGYEVRGIARDGTLSRWVGCFYTFVEYHGVSPPAVQTVDSVIDRLCFE